MVSTHGPATPSASCVRISRRRSERAEVKGIPCKRGDAQAVGEILVPQPMLVPEFSQCRPMKHAGCAGHGIAADVAVSDHLCVYLLFRKMDVYRLTSSAATRSTHTFSLIRSSAIASVMA